MHRGRLALAMGTVALLALGVAACGSPGSAAAGNTTAPPSVVASGGITAVPVQVIQTAALDPAANDRQLAAAIPGAQLVLYPGAGHGFLFQDVASFIPRLERFLS